MTADNGSGRMVPDELARVSQLHEAARQRAKGKLVVRALLDQSPADSIVDEEALATAVELWAAATFPEVYASLESMRRSHRLLGFALGRAHALVATKPPTPAVVSPAGAVR